MPFIPTLGLMFIMRSYIMSSNQNFIFTELIFNFDSLLQENMGIENFFNIQVLVPLYFFLNFA